MKIILSLLFLFTSINLHAYTLDKNVSAYLSLVNKAELNVIKEDYQQAIRNYDAAFVLNTPFAQDLYNASICAIKEKAVQKAFIFCKLLANKGVGANFLKQQIYKPLNDQEGWKELMVRAEKVKAVWLKQIKN